MSVASRGPQLKVGEHTISNYERNSHIDQLILENVIRLPKNKWPLDSNGRRAWPDSLTISELLDKAHSRSGFTKSPADSIPKSNKLFDSAKETFTGVERSSKLRRQAVSNNIIGIRPSSDLSPRYLGYFRYRWNYLILIDTFLPLGLVNYLTKKWKCEPTSLWMVEQQHYKKFLKSHFRK